MNPSPIDRRQALKWIGTASLAAACGLPGRALATASGRVVVIGGQSLPWDRLVLSPGIDFRWGALQGYDEAATLKAPHAWKAGPQTQRFYTQLREMPDGGIFILVAPANPYRCPPGTYERVSMIAHYFKHHKPRAKILILDAKDAFSKQGLFTEGWREHYGQMIEWVSRSADGHVVRVDADRLKVETEFGAIHKASVLNVVPPQKAGAIAERAGLTDDSGWAPVRPSDFSARQMDGVYVIGDAAEAAPMPKSGFVANTQAKVVASAIAADLSGMAAPAPAWTNTCYSLVAPEWGISVANVYEVHDGALREVPGSGGVSPANAPASMRREEATYGAAWYAAILGAQALSAFAGLDLRPSLYYQPGFSWLAIPLGGIAFGYGMILAQGCGSRALVLLGDGNLRSLVVLLCLGLAAGATLTGPLAPGRIAIAEATTLSPGLPGLPGLFAAWGAGQAIAGWVPALALFLILAIAALWRLSLYKYPGQIAAACLIGCLPPAGWAATAILGADPFDPAPVESLTFVAPIGDTLQYLMLSTGLDLRFGVAVVAGALLGSTAMSVSTRSFELRGFESPRHMLRAISGGALMGAGGSLALGCSIGQGLTGLSTLSLSSLLAVAGILAGARLAMRRDLKREA